MSWVSDSTELVSGGWLSSAYAGHGILGSSIPATGDNGGSPALNDGVLANSEYRWTLETAPASGSLTVFEDLTFEYSNAVDGFYSFVYRLYEDGASAGTATVNLQIGPSHSGILATIGNLVCSLSSGPSGAAPITTITAASGAVVGSLVFSGKPLVLTPADIDAIAQAVLAILKTDNSILTVGRYLALKD